MKCDQCKRDYRPQHEGWIIKQSSTGQIFRHFCGWDCLKEFVGSTGHE